jgi:hypothetical protein
MIIFLFWRVLLSGIMRCSPLTVNRRFGTCRLLKSYISSCLIPRYIISAVETVSLDIIRIVQWKNIYPKWANKCRVGTLSLYRLSAISRRRRYRYAGSPAVLMRSPNKSVCIQHIVLNTTLTVWYYFLRGPCNRFNAYVSHYMVGYSTI